MSLPPGFLDELRNRVSISQVVGRKVIWDTRKSNQAKGDMWAPCPFHQEKSASFHVDDRKGFYYCFGCHAKGDALGFIQQAENVGFMEAVEMLAREAGMPMPARDPQASERIDRATKLAAATEAGVAHFRLQLRTAAAAEARAYLDRRGLDAATLERFEIGFAPAARQGVFGALTAKGIAAEDVIEAGLATRPDDGSAPYDAFRDRIIFPIRDARGRCIGFGGRAMAADARAKYLNSRETPLFDKGRALYNHGPAREAAGKGQPLIVAEGYMDVIALVQAGFGAAVAPLGTAITADQLRLMWRIADEPIIALDGDTAGLRAALRLVDLALPMLEPGKTLRFCLMPEGQDPDDLIKARGADAMRALLDTAEPLVRMLWRRETEGQVFDSPERRAALDGRLRQAIGKIPDQGLRRHYGEALAELRRALFRPTAPQGRDRGQWRARGFAEAQMPLAETRSSALGSGALSADDLRVMLILATLCRYPGLIERFETELERLAPRHPDHVALVDVLLSTQAGDEDGVSADCAAAGLAHALESLRGMAHLRITPILSGPPDPAKAALCLTEEFAKYSADRAMRSEMSEALEDLDRAPEGDMRLGRRLNHAVHRRQTARRAASGEASSAVGEDTAALSDRLRALIEARVWEKKGR
ncbi:DNA primase [Roseicyclus mahoneyensis]|uniref:DNA primase n=1 Tax=Roseicyclus mahoneyensis TaxID=164332 RepID=A0A316GJD8_9RHOB|nr:DNA primase [Roseicyclus mahoneyensis]PWK60901.1 DNA primase [Roseicyclus mahoneyensis]